MIFGGLWSDFSRLFDYFSFLLARFGRSPSLLVLNTTLLLDLVYDRFGIDFLGVRGRFSDDFSSFLAYFGHAFSCSCWGGVAKNLPRTKPRIQEPAEDKAENKIRTNAFKKTQISKLSSSKLPSLSQPSLLQKPWAAVLPPGGLQ